MEILLARHGLSQANTHAVDPQQTGDHNIELEDKGKKQALDLGAKIGDEFLQQALIYNSPYLRTRQTLNGIIEGAGAEKNNLIIYEDPRLREVEHGFHGNNVEVQEPLREVHGYFYYRFKGGESPADCYDRVATFLESLQRQLERKGREKVLIVSHGLTIRCFVMRFLHLTVEQFERMANPENCDCIRIAHKKNMPDEEHVFTNGNWAVSGLRLRQEAGE